MHSAGDNRRSCGSVSRFGHPRINARLPASRGLSQAAASFVASRCQDIHRTPLRAWPRLPIAVHHWAATHPTPPENTPGEQDRSGPARAWRGRTMLADGPTLRLSRRPAGNGPTIAKKGARRRPPDGKHCSGAPSRGNGRTLPGVGITPDAGADVADPAEQPHTRRSPRHRWADRSGKRLLGLLP